MGLSTSGFSPTRAFIASPPVANPTGSLNVTLAPPVGLMGRISAATPGPFGRWHDPAPRVELAGGRCASRCPLQHVRTACTGLFSTGVA